MSSPVGARGPDYEMVVERGKIAEFAVAMQSQNPAYAGPGAIAPPTFLISGSLWAPDGAAVDVGFDRRRLLHGEQEFIFHGPPPRAGQVWPDDVLTCSGEITAIGQNESGALVTAELTATRQTGGVAVSASADFLLPTLPLI
jgi:N-terminal half of MaoC dehydratase